MKTAFTAIIVASFIAFQNTTANAQFDMNELQAQQQCYMNMADQHYQAAQQQLQHNIQQTEANMNAANRQVIDEYRRRTNDNQTPDQVVLDHEIQAYFARNPQARMQNQQFQENYNNQHQINMNQIHQAGVNSQNMANHFNEINEMSMQGYYDRNQVSDHSQRQFINDLVKPQQPIDISTGCFFCADCPYFSRANCRKYSSITSR